MAVEQKGAQVNISEEVKDGDSKGEVVIDIKDDENSNSIPNPNTVKACRICLESSSEEKIIALGCDCRGELGFAHHTCAATWFSIKRNRECEICGKTTEKNERSSVRAVRDGVLRERLRRDNFEYEHWEGHRCAQIGGFLLLSFIMFIPLLSYIFTTLFEEDPHF